MSEFDSRLKDFYQVFSQDVRVLLTKDWVDAGKLLSCLPHGYIVYRGEILKAHFDSHAFALELASA